jgi:hypothetical protein
VLADRAQACVAVQGTGRLAVAIATLLAAANVGRVTVQDSGEVHRHDWAPGGLQSDDEGRRFQLAASDAIRRAGVKVDSTALGAGERADLVVLTGETPIEPEVRAQLHQLGAPHLIARIGSDEAIVGPLVLPGLTSCLRCADLTRLDRDPQWSALAVQLATTTRRPRPAEIGLCMFAAGLTVMQVLAYLDGEEPATLSASLELHPPDWRLRRRTWPQHAQCDCGIA